MSKKTRVIAASLGPVVLLMLVSHGAGQPPAFKRTPVSVLYAHYDESGAEWSRQRISWRADGSHSVATWPAGNPDQVEYEYRDLAGGYFVMADGVSKTFFRQPLSGARVAAAQRLARTCEDSLRIDRDENVECAAASTQTRWGRPVVRAKLARKTDDGRSLAIDVVLDPARHWLQLERIVTADGAFVSRFEALEVTFGSPPDGYFTIPAEYRELQLPSEYLRNRQSVRGTALQGRKPGTFGKMDARAAKAKAAGPFYIE